MKITTKELRQIIAEELNDVIEVLNPIDGFEEGCQEEFDKCMETKGETKGDECLDEAGACNWEKSIDKMSRSNIKRNLGDRLYGHLEALEKFVPKEPNSRYVQDVDTKTTHAFYNIRKKLIIFKQKAPKKTFDRLTKLIEKSFPIVNRFKFETSGWSQEIVFCPGLCNRAYGTPKPDWLSFWKIR